jgi:hypothetical protein
MKPISKLIQETVDNESSQKTIVDKLADAKLYALNRQLLQRKFL